jgi:hypothetical protein
MIDCAASARATGQPVHDFIARLLSNWDARIEGPMRLRLVLQPLVACFFAIRSGSRDARAGNDPLILALASGAKNRAVMVRQIWSDIGKVFVAAAVLDLIFQIIALRTIYVGEILIAATILALVPYALIRVLATRIARKVTPR